LRVCLRLPAYSASAKVICFIGKLGGRGRGILPNQKVFFRVSLVVLTVCLQRPLQHPYRFSNVMKGSLR
ncbi:hypothetical protein KZ843_29830, partial [Pseudomonas aeruginosa]